MARAAGLHDTDVADQVRVAHRDGGLNDLAVEPLFTARLSGNRNTLQPVQPEQLVVCLSQDRHPTHTVFEVDAVLEADVGLDDRRLARMITAACVADVP